MARTDIAGLLTGIPSGRPDPMGMGGNASQQRLAFGAQRAEGLQRGVRGMMGGDTNTPAEQLQIAMAGLDLSNPVDLRKLAGIQQATGDLAGAAKTAAGIRELELEGKTRTSVSDALIKLGDPENAQRVLDKTLPTVQGQQQVSRLESERRAADNREKLRVAEENRKLSETQAKLPTTIITQERILKSFNLPEDHPIWAEVRAADYGDTTVSEFNSIAKALVPDSNVTRETSTKYIVNGKAVWAAETTIGKQPQELMYPSGTNADGSTRYIPLPTDAKKYTDTSKAGVTITARDSEDARYEIVNAGKRNGKDNSAFNNLSSYDQDVLIDNIAARTNEIVKEQGLNEPEARKQAVLELYLNRIEETPKEERNYLDRDMYRFKTPPEEMGSDPEATIKGVAGVNQSNTNVAIEGDIVTNPTTKEQLQLINGKWVSL
tara:strand:+ start:207 stop:1508 length:1302 start_codon:yes stop_codon:yes gene_type:complete